MPASFDEEDVARLRIALARIARQLDRQTRGETFSRAQTSVLATVGRIGPLRISELADIEGLNPTMLSRIVGKLEDAGLLLRRPDPDDRRAAFVETTEAGKELHMRLRAERTRLLSEHLTGLSDAEAAQLLAALSALESLATTLTPEARR
ncbi:MarR family winged helix-turn-helix transcriptional regulator [Pseudonocardia sp. TRM90224]|uniref:MarR family winged helix-turn-helix transcriptional regulator n=1 Tax=Pseudonocardia sp. TRM90224 TaxID=2812678 RepID=UPI001E4D8CAD|nr:MarR family transcriptional regulator [Pseudonocardia sp. TRM90224]